MPIGNPLVIINVSGGVAEVVAGEAAIIDWDELMSEDCESEDILTSLKVIRCMTQDATKDNMMSSLIEAADHHPKCYWVYIDGYDKEFSKHYPTHSEAREAAHLHPEELFALTAEDSALYIEPVI